MGVVRGDLISDCASDEFLRFINENPTIYHSVNALSSLLNDNGFKLLPESEQWKLEAGGKYYVIRNGSSIISFIIGDDYKPGDGCIIIAGHLDALTLRLKPNALIKPTTRILQAKVSPYANAGNQYWLDRDLGFAGRAMIRAESKGARLALFKLPHAIGKITSLAPHFGIDTSSLNSETKIDPIIGECDEQNAEDKIYPHQLLSAIAKNVGVDAKDIIQLEGEFFDFQEGQYLGLNKEYLSIPRCDDKLCSWSAFKAISEASTNGGAIRVAAAFDNEEVGSLTYQGAKSNFLEITLRRILNNKDEQDTFAISMAKSFYVSADVSFAFDPKWPEAYEEHQRPELNIGPVISFEPNGKMTSDVVSATFSKLVAERCGLKLQTFQPRNDTRSGGTIGPMLSAQLGIRAADIGLAELGMHSIRSTTGAKEPEIGVKYFTEFFDSYEDLYPFMKFE